MIIRMTALEHNLAGIDLRERLSFTKAQTSTMVKAIRLFPGIAGCVLISTCNRTELYISCDGAQDPGQLLCQAAGTPYAPYQSAFVTRSGEEAVTHLMEVAAGLRSRIWGEDQIISQVKNALTLSREVGCTDSELETLFRFAIAAGKQVRSEVRLTTLPTSAAAMAVAHLARQMGTLRGTRALVIGNGEMGRLAAKLLREQGAQVSMTLRTYRHGETIVPPGCHVVPYDDRFPAMEGLDLLISATTSPHYTITKEQLSAVSEPPKHLVDLAIPRDIQPEVGSLLGVHLYNVDDLGDFREHRTVPPKVQAILREQREKFDHWRNYRSCMTGTDSLKDAILERLTYTPEREDVETCQDALELAVSKSVDLLLGGLAEGITPENLSRCESKIRLHTVKK